MSPAQQYIPRMRHQPRPSPKVRVEERRKREREALELRRLQLRWEAELEFWKHQEDYLKPRETFGPSKPPSYCCQRCGEQIGWIGRFFQWLRFPNPFHNCK